jgi:hypothetical protein
MFKKTLPTAAIALLLCAGGVAQANDYYVVVPVPNRTATAGNILVSLSGYSLPSGLIGHAYSGFDFSSVLQVSGDPNYTPSNVRWSVSGGALPAGLSLSTDGKLSGTPTAAGTVSFQLTATYKTKSGQQAYQVFVADITVGLSSASLPGAKLGTAYTYDFKPLVQVTGDPSFNAANASWSVTGGALPAGLTLGADGKLSGTPTAPGTSSFRVTVSYLTKSGQQAYQVIVADITVALAGATLPDGTRNVAYTYDFKPLVSVSGDSTFTPSQATWSVSSGTLPAGLQLNSDGTLAGVPTKGGSSSFTVTATYHTKAGTQTYSVTIAAAVNIAIADASLTAYLGYGFNSNLKSLVTVTTDNYSPSQLAVSLTRLPTGLSFDTSVGALSGTPTQQGSYPLTLTATYGSKSVQKTYTLAVTAYKSCADYLAKNPGAPSGTYLLDVDGSGPVPSMNYSCDMTSDGGGWTRIVRQTDANPVTNWNGGVNGMSYAVATQFIPAHTQVAFGKDETATALDYVNWTYSTGDIAVRTVTSPKTGLSYQVQRSAGGYYNSHDPENAFNTALSYWTNTLTFDRIGINPAYTWAFSPLAYTSGVSNLYGGYSFNGTITTNTLVSYAWTVWVR